MGSFAFGAGFFGEYTIGGDAVSPLSIIEANGEYLPAIAVSGEFKQTVITGDGEFNPVIVAPNGSID